LLCVVIGILSVLVNFDCVQIIVAESLGASPAQVDDVIHVETVDWRSSKLPR